MKVIFMILISTTNFIIDILVLVTCTSCDRLPLTFMLESGCATLNCMLYAQVCLQPQFVRQMEHYLLHYMIRSVLNYFLDLSSYLTGNQGVTHSLTRRAAIIFTPYSTAFFIAPFFFLTPTKTLI